MTAIKITTNKKPTTIDQYIEQCTEDSQKVLGTIRSLIASQVPEAEEIINYGIPTFKLNGKNLVHFAAFKHHVGFYPSPAVINAFQNELKPYKQAKGSVQFPLDQPIPFDLIIKMTEYRVQQQLSE